MLERRGGALGLQRPPRRGTLPSPHRCMPRRTSAWSSTIRILICSSPCPPTGSTATTRGSASGRRLDLDGSADLLGSDPHHAQAEVRIVVLGVPGCRGPGLRPRSAAPLAPASHPDGHIGRSCVLRCVREGLGDDVRARSPSTAVGTSSTSPSIVDPGRAAASVRAARRRSGERRFAARASLVQLEQHLADPRCRSWRIASSTSRNAATAPAGSATMRCRSVWSSSTAHVTVWVSPSWMRIAQRVRSSSTAIPPWWQRLRTHRLRRVRLFAGCAHVGLVPSVGAVGSSSYSVETCARLNRTGKRMPSSRRSRRDEGRIGTRAIGVQTRLRTTALQRLQARRRDDT